MAELEEKEIAGVLDVEGAVEDAGPPLTANESRTLAPLPQDTHTSVLFHSNAPWVGTGYGTQTALFGPQISKLGYRLAFSAFYGLKGNRLGWVSPDGQQFHVYPGGRNPYGNDVLGAHAKHWFEGRGGLVLTLTDPWVLNANICSMLPLAAWTPVDHEPLMPRTHTWLAQSNAVPIAMSRFGQRMMENNGFKPLYLPHAFNPQTFTQGDREGARAALGIPQDAFVVGMVAANKGAPSRKCFAQAFAGFSEFRKRVGRQAVLYLHTKLEDPEGENLPALAESLGITPMTTDPYAHALGTPARSVGALMNAFDVLLNPSSGEGFGVPLIESQACGTPVVTTDFSAMPEVAPAEHGNWNVGGAPIWTQFESWQVQPYIQDITDALVEAFEESEADRLARRDRVAAFVNAEYQIEHVAETYLKPVMEDALNAIAWREKRMARG